LAEDVARAEDPEEVASGWRRLGRTSLRVLAVMVVTVLVLELGVRLISAHLPTVETDDSQELVIKAERIERLGAGGQPVGAVVFGSSAMDAGVAPATFDAASTRFDGSFNAALIGTPLATQERWAHDVVLEQLDPQVAIVGVSPLEVHQNQEAEDLAPVDAIFDASFREVEDGALPSLERWASDRSQLVRYRGSLRHPRYVGDAIVDTVTRSRDFPRIDRPEGYWEQNLDPQGAVLQYRDRQLGAVSPELVAYLDTTFDSPYRPERLEALLDRLEEAEVPVVLVSPPIADQALAAAGADVAAYQEAVAEIAATAEERGLPFIDLSTGYDSALFADPLHLNAAGTEQLSRDLAAAVDAACAAAGAATGCAGAEPEASDEG
jgi:hypothetical protein